MHQTLHPTQYSSKGGAQRAAGIMNIYSERVLAKCGPLWCVSLDLAKMFNRLSITVAKTIATYMGLSQQCADQMAMIIEDCKGVWRLPFNSVAATFRRSKGIPQGMATSVAMAELAVASFLWRLHAIVPVITVVYVDDINVIATDREHFQRALALILEWVSDFQLDLARNKSCLWGTDPRSLSEISELCGIPVKDTVTTLGMQWPLSPSAAPTYDIERSRLDNAKNRLARLEVLHIGVLEKARIINTGCLSPLDYAPIPLLKCVEELKMCVKRAVGQTLWLA